MTLSSTGSRRTAARQPYTRAEHLVSAVSAAVDGEVGALPPELQHFPDIERLLHRLQGRVVEVERTIHANCRRLREPRQRSR